MMTATKMYYGVLIQTEPNGGFTAKVGWDDVHTKKTDAVAMQKRAEAIFPAAKVVEMTEDEAVENGWL